MNGNTILGISRGTLGGFGTGIVVSTVFLAATSVNSLTTADIFTNPLTLVLTAIGFGLGLGEGMISEAAASTPKA